jgi:Gpi18-like mannosyltransferase
VKLSHFWIWLLGLSALGFGFRYWLAFSVFLNQGFAWDMATFGEWIGNIRAGGTEAYAINPGFNYPPVFADILVGLDALASVLGVGVISLLKLPSIIADIAIACTLAFAGRKWFTSKIGVIAAGLYLVSPVVWYDSAIWGQVDSLSALPMLLAVVFLIDRKPELASVFFMLAVLLKPQGALVLLILLPVFIGQIRYRELGANRIATTFASALATFAVVAVPWSLEAYVPNDLAKVPLLGDAVGLIYQYFMTAGMFPVLTANAFNIWALVGKVPLAEQMQDDRAIWITDNYQVFGLPAGLIGGALFLAVAAFIFWTLIKRHNAQQVLTGFALLLVAFFVLPTRVHERYLAQAFAVLALVWAVKAWQRAGFLVLSIANTVNLHAILAADLRVETAVISSSPSASGSNSGFSQGVSQVVVAANPQDYGIDWVRLPTEWSRAEPMVLMVILIHVLAFAVVFYDYYRANDLPLPKWSRLRRKVT